MSLQLPIEWLPAGGAPEQLLVLLHGVGASGSGMAGFAQMLRNEFPQAAVLAPDAPNPFDGGGLGRQWFSVAGVDEANRPARVAAALPALVDWVKATQRRLGVGPAATALAGFSQGGILALEAAALEDGLAGRVLAFGARYAQLPAAAPRHTTVHLFHGAADPVIAATHARAALEHLGALLFRQADACVRHGKFKCRVTGFRHFACLDAHAALRRELDRVAHQVGQHLAQPQGVALVMLARRPVPVRADLQPLRARAFAEQGFDLAQQLPRLKRRGVELKLAGLDLGQVQDVVEQRQQRVPRLQDGAGRLLALRPGHARLLQQLRHAQDAVHGRADFMAHGRQEPALGHAGCLSPVACLQQVTLQLFAHGQRNLDGQPHIEQQRPQVRPRQQGAGGDGVVRVGQVGQRRADAHAKHHGAADEHHRGQPVGGAQPARTQFQVVMPEGPARGQHAGNEQQRHHHDARRHAGLHIGEPQLQRH